MTAAFVTGWLQKDAWAATVPSTLRRIVSFDLVTRSSAGEEVPWRCEIRDEQLATRVEAKLCAGAAVMVTAKLDGRPFVKRGVQEGWTRLLAVEDVEFSRVMAPRGEAERAGERAEAADI